MKLKLDEDLRLACRTLIGAQSAGGIKGKLWIVERARVREYRPEMREAN